MDTVVVTRHAALVEFLIESGHVPADVKVIAHASEADVRGKDVWGVLPLRLAQLACCVTEIPLNIPQFLRGRELNLAQVREYAGEPECFIVRSAWDVPIEEQIYQL
jgi:putative CRISPR-associated protein (TIGR02620 family)